MATAYGIVLVGKVPHKLCIEAKFRAGPGRLFIKGPIGPEVRQSVLAATHAARDLDNYADGLDIATFGHSDLYLTFVIEGCDAPVVGDSYGLALTMAVLAAMLRKRVPSDLAYVGSIGPAGECIPVEGIERKRSAVATLGFGRIMLPAPQLDMFNSEIMQSPVNNVREAFSVTFYGE